MPPQAPAGRPPPTVHAATRPQGAEVPRAKGLSGFAHDVRRALGLAENEPLDPERPRQRDASGRESAPAPPPLENVAAGRLSLMGLAEIRQELGPRWEALSEKVHAIAHKVVERHLTRGDVFERQGEDSYVLLFAQLSKADAEFKCGVIRNEIGRQLLGSEWAGLSRVDAQCVEVAREKLGTGDLQLVLAKAFDGAMAIDRAIGLPPGEPAPNGGHGTTPSADGMDLEGEPPTVLRSAPFEIVEPPAQPVDPAAERARWSYSLIWDFSQMALIRFRLVAKTAAGRRVHPFHDQDGEATHALLAHSDMLAVAKAVLDLTQLSAAGRRLAVTCPIHHSSLTRESWASRIVQLVAQAPAPARRLLTLEICGPAAGATNHSVQRFSDIMGRLRVACTGCWDGQGKFAPRTRGMPEVMNLELPQHPGAEAASMRLITSAAQECGRAELTLGVYGLSSRSLVVCAASSGFRYLSGTAIHADVPALDHAVRFDLADFYREFLPA